MRVLGVGTPVAPCVFFGLGHSFSEARAASLNGPAMSFSLWAGTARCILAGVEGGRQWKRPFDFGIKCTETMDIMAQEWTTQTLIVFISLFE